MKGTTIKCPACGTTDIAFTRVNKFKCNKCKVNFEWNLSVPKSAKWEKMPISSEITDKEELFEEWEDFGWEYDGQSHVDRAIIKRDTTHPSYSRIASLQKEHDDIDPSFIIDREEIRNKARQLL